MNELGEWKLSPAYDITFSNGPGGEQSTMVLGEGRNITVKHLSKLGTEAQLSKEFIESVIDQTRSALGKWIDLAKYYGVNDSNINIINRGISKL
jgi:serine/threonine-protein kinase HipA